MRTATSRDHALRPTGCGISERFFEGGTECVLIRACIGGLASMLLGRHVARRAADRASADHRGNAEVRDRRAAPARDQHVVGLEIEMDEALAVDVREPCACLGEHRDDLARRTGSIGEPLAQRRADHELHAQIHASVLGTRIVDRDDVAMRQPRHRARFGEQQACITPVIRSQQLQRDAPMKHGVVSFVDHPHATDTDHPANLVATDELAFARQALEGRDALPEPRDELTTCRTTIEVLLEAARRGGVQASGDQRGDRVVTGADRIHRSRKTIRDRQFSVGRVRAHSDFRARA